jgi:hypothetical protein
MSLVQGNQKLGRFAPSIRTMWLHLSSLSVSRSWNPEDPFSEQPREMDPNVDVAISGIADLGECSISVVGSELPAVRQFSFMISPAKQADANQRWARVKSLRGDWFADLLSEDPEHPDQGRLVQYLRNTYEQFDERGPTARLYHRAAYWEAGIEEGWEGSCEISPDAFAVLVADIHAERCTQLTVGLKLQPMLSDSEHAPPSLPVTFGVLSHGRHAGGTNEGWVRSIAWNTVEGRNTVGIASDHTVGSLSGELDIPFRNAPDLPVTCGAAEESHRSISRLAATVRTGFLLLFVLIVLSVLFR